MTLRARKRLTIELLMMAVLLGVFLARIPDVFAKRSDAFDFFDRLVDIRAEIIRNYYEEPDDEQMAQGAIGGMIDTLDDPYTVYFTAEQLESFETQTRGTFTGIGAEIDEKDNYIVIVSPLEDSPAYKAGLIAGDLLLKVDDFSLEGATSDEAVKRITGPEGTQVKLAIRHADGSEQDVTITRQRIEIQTVKGIRRDTAGIWDYMLDPANRIGYVRMTQFSEPTYDNLVKALDELDAQNMAGLILDLRYNPGGLLDSAIKVADLFLDKGVVVSTRGRNSPEHIWNAAADNRRDDYPIIVLVNEASASASEILAGALKYNDRAVVLGTRTVGKGSVQQIIPLDGGAGGIKLTTALYYMPNGQNIHRHETDERWGVDPSDGFYVAVTAEQIEQMIKVRRENGNAAPPADTTTPDWVNEHLADPQLAAALQSMQQKLAEGDWLHVGPGDALVLAHLTEKQNLELNRKRYMERIDLIDKELQRVQTILTTGETPPAEADPQAATETPQQVDPQEQEQEMPAEKLPESEQPLDDIDQLEEEQIMP